MEYRILGPLEVLHEGRQIALGAAQPRAVLAVLLLHANEVVSVDRLVDELWGESPPPTATKTKPEKISTRAGIRLSSDLSRPAKPRPSGTPIRLPSVR